MMSEQPRLGTDIAYAVYPDGMVRATVTDDDGERVHYVPHDEGNVDYADYLAWREAGNEPEQLGEVAHRD